MKGPGQHKLPAVGRDPEIIHGFPIRQALARVIDRGLHVDQGDVAQFAQRHVFLVVQIILQVASFGERSNPNRVAIRSDHWYRLTYMFSSDAVHDDARPCFKPVYRHVRGNDKRAAAETRHSCLERCQGSQ